MKRLIILLFAFLGMVFPVSASEIEVSGHISTDTLWDDTVNINGEVIVDDDIT